MLQNPSKYHSNPLSHFLALHNSQVAHNAHSSMPAGTIATGNVNGNNNNGGSSSNNNSQFHQHHPTIIMANHHHLHNSHHHHHHNNHHQHLNSSTHSHAHLIDAANTSLDVGKSFTIAAILGLHKSAIGNNRKEYNNVINLSLNGGGNNSSNNSNHPNLNVIDDDIEKNSENQHFNSNNANNNTNNNNNNSSSSNSCKTNMSNNFNNSVNNFNCDSSNNIATINNAALVVNRYLPSANVNSAAAAAAAAVATSFAASAAAASHQHQQQQQQNLVLSHVRAVATAAAAANVAGGGGVGGAPSALQSLQQLHQHHAQQQASLSFQREKHKTDNTKKSSLKNKRVRTIFTPEQLERLEAEFERQQYMVGPERLYLAHTLQLTEAQVKVWFQNRRIKWRKHHLEITQQRLALLRQSQLPPTTTTATAAVGVGTGIAAVNTGIGMNASSPRSCEDMDELKHNNDEMRHLSVSRQASESDLSICNDSMDAESVIDGGEDT